MHFSHMKMIGKTNIAKTDKITFPYTITWYSPNSVLYGTKPLTYDNDTSTQFATRHNGGDSDAVNYLYEPLAFSKAITVVEIYCKTGVWARSEMGASTYGSQDLYINGSSVNTYGGNRENPVEYTTTTVRTSVSSAEIRLFSRQQGGITPREADCHIYEFKVYSVL